MLRILSNPTNRHFVDGRYWHYYRRLDQDSRDVASVEAVLFDIETLDRLMKIADHPLRFMSDTGVDVPFSNLTQYHPFVEDGNLPLPIPDCLTEAGEKFYFMMMESCKFLQMCLLLAHCYKRLLFRTDTHQTIQIIIERKTNGK